ncbi:MAG TPA: VCBS repeat-containing protein [Verrucomicrobiae bacterium]
MLKNLELAGWTILTAGSVFLPEMEGVGAPAAGLTWQPSNGYRSAKVTAPPSARAGFTLLAGDKTGIRFTNMLSYDKSVANQNLLNGAGVAAGDYDGDGWPDLYFCNLEGSNKLYRNLGDWTFEDVTDKAGVGCGGMASTGAVFADLNGDGWLDLLVTSCGGPNACFLNDGQGRFANVTTAAGLTHKAGDTTLALADIDGDGDLDLYVANYGEYSILRGGGAIAVEYKNGKPVVRGRWAKRIKIVEGQMFELGEPDSLYLNDGQGHFTPVSWTDGAFLDEDGKPLAEAPWDMGLSAMFRDINGDGFPDLYVCNDFQTPDRVWMNDGKGHFRALPRLALRCMSNFSMSVDFADINRDGLDDFFTADMLSRRHTLRMTQLIDTNFLSRAIGEIEDRPQIRRNACFLNRGNGTYAEIANFGGVDASDWTWSAVFLDVDLDGYEDLLIGNGHAYDTQDLDAGAYVKSLGKQTPAESKKNLAHYPRLEVPNLIFRNRGNLTFQEVGAQWGFDSKQVSHGIALVDLDNDGDLDVVVSCLNAPPLIYRNESDAPRLGVRLKGKPPNTRGIGAKIKVLGGPVPQSQEMICGGRYLSCDDAMRTFAGGHATNLTIEVTWRNGTRSLVSGAKPDHIYEVDEAGASGLREEAPRTATPLFQDVGDRIAHLHHEEPFDDFARQPLLTRRLSQLGPGVAWFDLDGDGHDELIIGSGRGGALAVYRNDGQGGLTRWNAKEWSAPAADDLTAIVGWEAAGKRCLLVVQANYEAGGESIVSRFDPGATPHSALRTPHSSIGPLCVADIDGDGDLDVFVGGRVIPGRYPEVASSALYRNEQGQLVLDAANSRLLENAGLVSGAVFSDLDGDGLPELILACEWGPLRIFRNHGGKFSIWDAPISVRPSSLTPLSSLVGWWNSVTTGDLDGDGRLDIIAGNWGLNSAWQASDAAPLLLYYGDFAGARRVDPLEASFDPAFGKIMPHQDLSTLGPALPFLRERFATHRAYSTAAMADVLGDQFPKAQRAQANTLASMLFLNRGDRFEPRPLPPEAQFAPVFGINVADFDGDGREDVFLAQNFFATRKEIPRMDAGLGLLLRGNGSGKLAAVPCDDSGIKVYGEQRGSAVADFDEDGRVDLVVTQNGAATKLYRNNQARPGLRVRLSGPAENPTGIGATVRLMFGDKAGPAREIRGGSGYWSQDSAVQVLSLPTAPSALWVRWPGGRATSNAIPTGAREVIVDASGSVEAMR